MRSNFDKNDKNLVFKRGCATVTAVVSWPSVFRHCLALVSKAFRCFCLTVFVLVVVGVFKIFRRLEI